MNANIKAVQEMVTWVREHRIEYNSFNRLVDEAAQGNEAWLQALTDPGVALLMKTYCHD